MSRSFKRPGRGLEKAFRNPDIQIGKGDEAPHGEETHSPIQFARGIIGQALGQGGITPQLGVQAMLELVAHTALVERRETIDYDTVVEGFVLSLRKAFEDAKIYAEAERTIRLEKRRTSKNVLRARL